MASKSKKRRRVLGASCILAALIIAGSSFAWFTSKDEVTNRLTASAEYGVAIAENFQPPEKWVPGQEINKDVSAVNTGNVDAFVRTWLTGSMRVMKQTTSKTGANLAAFKTLTTEAVTDSNIKGMGLTKFDPTNEVYYKTLDKTQTINPNAAGGTDKYGFGGQMSGPYSEVQAMQGSRLASYPTSTESADYAFVLKEETKLPVWLSKGSGAAAYETVSVPTGTLVIVNAPEASRTAATLSADGTFTTVTTSTTITPSSGSAYTSTSTVYVDTLPILTNVEYESFTPLNDGLYLFLRNEADADLSVDDLEYSGYYVTGITTNNASTGIYHALNTNIDGSNRSDYTVKSVATTGGTTTTAAPIKTTIKDGVITEVTPDESKLEIYNAAYDALDDSKLKWIYDSTSGSEKLYAIYDVDSNTAFDKNKDIAVQIDLANVSTSAGQKWTALGGGTSSTYTGLTGIAATVYDGSKVTFYYNDDLEAGDTTAKLVDKVTLHKDVTNKAYLAFDFDLNVNLESIQVTFDQNGNEKADAVASGWAATKNSSSVDVNTAAKKATQSPAYNADTNNAEIAGITWSETDS